MTIRLGVVMDPIQSIHYKKDSTLAMLWEAQARGFELYYLEQKDLFLRDGIPYGHARKLSVFKNPENFDEHLQHFTHFFDGVRNGTPVVEDPEFGFRAAAPCLAANDSYFGNKIIRWDPETMKLVKTL